MLRCPALRLTVGCREDVQLLESEEEKREEEEEKKAFEVTLRRVKEVLGERVEKVTLSHRMTSSPCVLVTGEFGWSAAAPAHTLHPPHTAVPSVHSLTFPSALP